MRLLYLAHPCGVEPQRAHHLNQVRKWFTWLISEYPDDVILCPWLIYVETLEETDANRARGIRDDLVVLSRCDSIVLCGGHLSPGMHRELVMARELGKEVIDLLWMGCEPPLLAAAEMSRTHG